MCMLTRSWSPQSVLMSLPMGFGKSLVFPMAPLVHAELSKFNDGFTANPIVIIISLLASLLEARWPNG